MVSSAKILQDGTNADHTFHPSWINQGGAGDGIARDGHQMLFADLRGNGKSRISTTYPGMLYSSTNVDQGRTDRILVDKHGKVFAWLNDGDGTNFVWNPANDGKSILDSECMLDRMRFPDLTGSGRADIVCIVGTNRVGKF